MEEIKRLKIAAEKYILKVTNFEVLLKKNFEIHDSCFIFFDFRMKTLALKTSITN
jgi:hypothetical protein